MVGNFPRFDIEIGGTKLSDAGLLQLVRSITVNKASDKTQMRGKRRTKINRCDITFSNPDGKIDNILRLGRKLKVWLGYQGFPLIRVGVYNVENPRWVYTENDVPTVQIRAMAGDVNLLYSKGGVAFRNVTHTGAAKLMTERHGLAFAGEETGVKTTLLKGASESDWDALERWAHDVGFEITIDDTTDPNTVHFEPITEVEPVVFSGQRLTLGWGPGTTATLPCQKLSIEHRYASTVSKANRRTETGKVAGFSLDGSFGLTPTEVKTVQKIYEHIVKALNTGPLGKMPQQLAGASHSGSPSKVLDATLVPGIPFLRLGQSIPLIERGDQSGLYRIVDITHEVNENGYITRIRATKGGLAAKKTKATAKNAKVGGFSLDGSLGHTPTTVPEGRPPPGTRPGTPVKLP